MNQSHKTAPTKLQISTSSLTVTCTSDPSEVPMTTYLGSINMLKWLTELRETLGFTSSLKDMRKNADKQPDDNVYRVGSGSVFSAGASGPMEIRCVILPVCGFVHPPGSSPNRIVLWGFYGHFLTRHLLSLWRMGDGANISKLLIMSWCFWCPASIQEPTGTHPE